MKERYLLLGVIIIVGLILAVGIMTPGREEYQANLLPWNLTPHTDGSSTVFGLQLGTSTLGDAERLFAAEMELTLFQSPQGRFVAEGYFDNLSLSGLIAKMVVLADVSQDDLQGMFERGIRMATLGDGSRKVTVHPEDAAVLRASPVHSLTYLPRSQLDVELVERRFGAPSGKRIEAGGEVEHWLYPQLGLDVAIHHKGKEVLQYVMPRDFSHLAAPLEGLPEKSAND